MIACASFSVSVYPQQVANAVTDEGLPREALDQLEKQSAAMARIRLEYTATWAGGDWVLLAGPTTYSAYFNSNRFFQDAKYLKRNEIGKVQADIVEVAFDGKLFYFGSPGAPPRVTPTYAKYLVDDVADPDRWKILVEFLYLNAASFYAPERIAELEQFSSIEPLVLHDMKESEATKVEKAGENLRVTVRITDPVLTAARETDLEKRRKELLRFKNGPEVAAKETEILEKMQRITPKRTVAFLIDPKRGYGVVERDEWSAVGQRILHIQSDQWKYYEAAGIWLPGRCVALYYTNPLRLTEFSVEPSFTITHQLKLIEFALQKNIQFVIDYKKPGTIVRDRTIPEARQSPYYQVQYTVAADGTLLRGIAYDLLLQKNRGRSLTFWFIVANVVILGLVITGLYIRHRKSCGKAE